MGELSVVVVGGLAILSVVITVLWIALPFAVFGIKGLLHDLINEQRKTNEQLEALYMALRLKAGRDRYEEIEP